MNTQIQAFAFNANAVRVVMINNAPWFVATDVCAALDIQNTTQALAPLDDDERKKLDMSDPMFNIGSAPGKGPQSLTIINESGLYTLILRSRDATTPGTPAHTFRKWVTAEVLPSIRQTGSYAVAGSNDWSAKLDRCVDLMEQVSGQTAQVLTLMEKLLEQLPKILIAARPPVRGGLRKKMYLEDAHRIQTLRAQGYTLEDLVSETEFSQSQCYAVISGRYKVLENGRVSIDLRSDLAKAADAAARADANGKLFLDGDFA